MPGIRIQLMVLISILSIVILVSSPQLTDAQQAPHPFAVAAQSAVLMDANSGQILYGQDPHKRMKPASFVKLLTLFLIFDSIDQGQILLEDTVWISKKAWRTGGSKMFVRAGTRIPLVELIKGIAVVSGNDACVAVAEFLQGSEQAFVDRMNRKSRELGLEDSKFQTVNGWPARDQYTTAMDMAVLARAYVRTYPQALEYHRLKEFTHENIRQRNRNVLLWRDSSVDGLKTGHTQEAGFHLLSTAKRGEQRFIAVVMGAESEAIREREARRLLNYGFRNFVAVELFQKGEVLAQLSVWKGVEGRLDLAAGEHGVVTVPISQQEEVSWRAEIPERLMAPVERGQTVGHVLITSNEKVLKDIPLLADGEIPAAGFFKRTLHAIALLTLTQAKLLIFAFLLLSAATGLFFYLKQRRPRRRRKP